MWKLYPVLLLLALLGCGQQGPPLSVTAKQLEIDYANEHAGNQKYANKLVEVRLQVGFIGTGKGGQANVYFRDWAFEFSDDKGVADLRDNDWIVLSGTVPMLKTTGPIPDRRVVQCKLVRKMTQNEIAEIREK